MRKDLWEADTFEGNICVRLSFWHNGRKGCCMRAIPLFMWEDLDHPKRFLEYTITEMLFDKEELIKSL